MSAPVKKKGGGGKRRREEGELNARMEQKAKFLTFSHDIRQGDLVVGKCLHFSW